MSGLRVLVVGASIAGPMAAYWLAKAGANVTVIERSPSLRPGGQNVDIRLIGVTVMRKIPGLEDAVRAALAPMDGFGLLDSKGRRIATLKGTGNAEEQSLVSEFEIFRDQLSRILYDLTKDSDQVKYIFGEYILSMQQQGDKLPAPIKVDFANGTPSAEYDLIVACDGTASQTRAMAFGCRVGDHVSPAGIWAAYFTIQQDLLNGDTTALSSSLPGGRSLGVAPDGPNTNRIFAVSVHSRNDDAELEKFRIAKKQGTDLLKKYIAQRFKSVGSNSSKILAELEDSQDLYASEMCQVKIPSLYRGRVALVGDAGYAAGPTGTGTSLALAGAYILAGEVSKHKGDLAAGLQAYQDRMEPIIKDMHVIPPGILSFMAPQTSLGILVRNLIFVVVCWATRFSSLFSWLGRVTGAAALGKDKHSLPDYSW